MSAHALLEVAELRGGYGRVEVLHGVSLHAYQGEIVVLLGANGAGKTTTLRAITGGIAASGQLTFAGKSLIGRSRVDIARLGVAHVPQGRGTFPHLSVEENLRAGGYLRKAKSLAGDLARWYDTFPQLAERRSQRAGQLSGGEQQMLAIARALMMRPRLLLLDEPSLGLAPRITQSLFATLAEINSDLGTTMLIVEQNAALALSIATRGFVLESGATVAADTADSLREDDRVRRAYLGR